MERQDALSHDGVLMNEFIWRLKLRFWYRPSRLELWRAIQARDAKINAMTKTINWFYARYVKEPR
jgi:hypothetical protein